MEGMDGSGITGGSDLIEDAELSGKLSEIGPDLMSCRVGASNVCEGVFGFGCDLSRMDTQRNSSLNNPRTWVIKDRLPNCSAFARLIDQTRESVSGLYMRRCCVRDPLVRMPDIGSGKLGGGAYLMMKGRMTNDGSDLFRSLNPLTDEPVHGVTKLRDLGF